MSNNLKEILLNIKSGKFKELIDKLDEENATITCSDAVRIIVLCSNICFDVHVIDRIKYEDLSLLVDKTLFYVSDLKDKLLDTYLQSIYFILKYFIEKKEYGIVVGKGNMLLPSFLQNMGTDKSKALYKNVCILIHNFIVTLLSKGDPDAKLKYFTQLCMLSCKMNVHVYPWNKVLSLKVNCYFHSCNSCNVNVHEQCKNYEEIFKMYELYLEEDSKFEDIFIGTLNYLKMIANNILEKGYWYKMNQFIETTLCILDKKFSGDEWDYVKIILRDCNKIMVEFSDYPNESEMISILSSLCIHLEKYSQRFVDNPIFHEICLFFNQIFYLKESCFEAVGRELWNKKITPVVQIGFYRLFSLLYMYFNKYEIVCIETKTSCSSHENSASISFAQIIASFFKTCVANDSDLPKENVATVLKQLQQCCEYIFHLKARKCLSWKSNWRKIGSTLYNIGIKLYQKSLTSSSDFFIIFITYLVKLEGLHKSEIRDNILHSATELLCEIYLQGNDLENALQFAAFTVYISKQNKDHNFKQWIAAKVALKKGSASPKLKEWTLTHALKSCNKTLKNIFPPIDKNIFVDLLIFEIKQYKILWPSKIPMAAVCRELYKWNEIEILTEILITIWNGSITLEMKIGDLIEDTIKKMKIVTSEDNIKNTKNQLHLACLYYLNYKYKTEEIRNIMSEELKNEIIPLKSPSAVVGVHSNSNDECDIVTTYEQLKVEEHAKTLQYLNVVVDYFEKNLPSHANSEIIAILIKIDAYAILIKVIVEYRLQCYSFQMLRAGFLSLQIARLFNDKFKILKSIAIILEFSNLNAEGTKELLEESEIIVSELPDSPEKHQLLVTFYMNKSLLHLYYDDVNNSVTCFEMAKENFAKIASNNIDNVLEIRLEYLEAKLMMLPCDLGIAIHGFTLAKLHYLLNNAIESYKNEGVGATAVSFPIVFEIAQEIFDLYTTLRWPRELRCYSKLILEISQEMVIPLRYCYTLVSLMHADLLTMKCNDCQVKISGLSHILSGSQNIPFHFQELEQDEHKLDIENLTNDFKELVLEIPKQTRHNQVSLGSPVLLQPLLLPAFIRHAPYCDCLHCMCIEYQELSIQKIVLEAELCIYQKELSNAQGYFDAAVRVCERINERSRCFDEKIAKKLSIGIFRNVKDILRRTYCSLLLKYGNNFMRLGNNEAALKYNKILIDNLECRKYSNAYLYNEACFQCLKLYQKPNLEIPFYNVKMFAEEEATNDQLKKTPETKQSTIIFTKIVTPHTSPPKRIRKVLKFDLSDDEETVPAPIKSPIVKVHMPISKNTTKTPAPASKIKIFTPATIKTTRSKKVLKTSNTNENDFLVPCSPEVYTPNSIKVYKEVENSLKTKTKLLTDKIKVASTKKAPSGITSAENEPYPQPSSSRTSVRKNLMPELDSASKIKIGPSKLKKEDNATKSINTRSRAARRVT